jgi:hypothetical protein
MSASDVQASAWGLARGTDPQVVAGRCSAPSFGSWGCRAAGDRRSWGFADRLLGEHALRGRDGAGSQALRCQLLLLLSTLASDLFLLLALLLSDLCRLGLPLRLDLALLLGGLLLGGLPLAGLGLV